MLQELDRSKNDLQLKGFEKPFFIQYRMEDVSTFDTRAEFGASEGSSRSHQRVARVTVRVGDYKTDSSGQRGDGAVQLTALDDDPIAIRSALWNATDQAYKNALSAYAQKQAELKQVQTPPQADDFSKQKAVIVARDSARVEDRRGRMGAARGPRQRPVPLRRDREGLQRRMCSTRRPVSTRGPRPRGWSTPKAPSFANRPRATRKCSRWAPRPMTACASTAPMAAPESPSRISIPLRCSRSTPSR